ncbi:MULTISPECIES: hypothetical protein [Methylobacter]
MVTVYRPDGVEEEKSSVDARECVEHCGYTYEPPVDFVDEGSSSLQTEGDTKKAAGTDKKSASATVEQIHDPNS